MVGSCMRTSLLSVDIRFDVGLFERTPFEVFPVTAALDLALCALLASGFLFATFQSFCFTRYTACNVELSVHVLSWPASRVRWGGHVFSARIDTATHTITTLRLLRLGWPIDRGRRRRLFTHGGLLGRLPASIFSSRRLVVSRSRRAWATA